jgi:hypothetical protein
MLMHKKPNTPTMVYLDQNKWIDLGLAYYRNPRGVRFAKTLQKMYDAAKQKTASFPFSKEHMLETMKMGKIDRRQRLAQVMAMFSEGWATAPWDKVNQVELSMSIPKAFNKPPLITSPLVFGRGIEFAFGEPLHAKSRSFIDSLNSPIEMKKRMAIQFLAIMMSSSDESLRKSSIDKYNASMNATADEADRIRKLVLNHNKDTRYRAFTAGHALDFFHFRQEELMASLTPIGLSFDDFFDTLGGDGLIKLFEDMPTTDILMHLRNQRNNQFEKAISPNDLNDLSFLAVAIPYCDVVITENQWVDLAKRKGFERKYNTVLLSDLAELANYI